MTVALYPLMTPYAQIAGALPPAPAVATAPPARADASEERTPARDMTVGSYTQDEVAALFKVSVPSLYEMPLVQQARIPAGGRGTKGKGRVRYSKRKIDAILNGEVPMPRRGRGRR